MVSRWPPDSASISALRECLSTAFSASGGSRAHRYPQMSVWPFSAASRKGVSPFYA